MRTRKVAAALLLTTVAFVALVGTAGAQDNLPEGKGEAETACIEILANGGSIDKCQQAPSPITPAKNELIWGIISFTVLLVALWKFAYPGLKKGMDARSERIAKSIDEAEAAKTEAQTLLDDYRKQLGDARNESSRVIEEARQQADALKRDQEARLQTELAEMRARAAADIESAKAQAVADLQADVAQIAIGAAEVVVQHSLDRETQTQLIENYINQVGSSR